MATRKRKREEEEDPRADDSSFSETDSLWEDDFALLATPSTPSTPSKTPSTPTTSSKKKKLGKGDYPKKIFLLGGGELGEGEEMIITKLPHPRTLDVVQFVVRGGKLFEIQQVTPERGLGSWFINQETTSDGKTYIVSEFDPLFLALSVLEEKGNGMYKDMNDLLTESATEKTREGMVHLGKCLASSSLEKICDSQKLGENEYYYRWNEELAIRWLIGKVGEVACELLANEIDIEGRFSAKSSGIQQEENTQEDNQKKEEQQQQQQRQNSIRKAIALLAEYTPPNLIPKLKEKLEIKEEEEIAPLSMQQKIELATANDPRALMMRGGGGKGGKGDGGMEETKPTSSLATVSSHFKGKEKKRREEKEKLGLRSISSFFGKKK